MALTQETQLLKLAQVSGSTVGICVVGTTLVVVVGTSVTLGARVVMLGCAAETQSTARQVAAQSSRREEPDIVSSAQARKSLFCGYRDLLQNPRGFS